MKNIFFFLLLLVAQFVSGENDFAPLGARWYYQYVQGNSYVTFVSEKDTVVNTKNCKVIGNEHGKEIMYEEEGKVYYWYDAKFRKIFDFTVTVGDSVFFEVKASTRNSIIPLDTVIMIHCAVENISYVNTENIPLKVVTVSVSNKNKPDYYIENWPSTYTYYEKIGYSHKYFILQISNWASTGEEITSLRCYHDNDINYTGAWWQSLNLPCDYSGYSGTNVVKSMEPSFYPNPIKDEIFIDFHSIGNPESCIASIFYISGKLVFSKQVEITDCKIDISTLSSGVYFLTLNNGTINLLNSKIVKL